MMVQMYVPKGKGLEISVNGVVLKADKDRVVEVPADSSVELCGHGLIRLDDEAALSACFQAEEAADQAAAETKPKARLRSR